MCVVDAVALATVHLQLQQDQNWLPWATTPTLESIDEQRKTKEEEEKRRESLSQTADVHVFC